MTVVGCVDVLVRLGIEKPRLVRYCYRSVALRATYDAFSRLISCRHRVTVGIGAVGDKLNAEFAPPPVFILLLAPSSSAFPRIDKYQTKPVSNRGAAATGPDNQPISLSSCVSLSFSRAYT
jgi:hypothetical protein